MRRLRSGCAPAKIYVNHNHDKTCELDGQWKYLAGGPSTKTWFFAIEKYSGWSRAGSFDCGHADDDY